MKAAPAIHYLIQIYRTQLDLPESAEADRIGPQFPLYQTCMGATSGAQRSASILCFTSTGIRQSPRHQSKASGLSASLYLCNETPTNFDPAARILRVRLFVPLLAISPKPCRASARRNGYDHFPTNGVGTTLADQLDRSALSQRTSIRAGGSPSRWRETLSSITPASGGARDWLRHYATGRTRNREAGAGTLSPPGPIAALRL